VQSEPTAALLLATARSPARAALLPLLASWAPGRAAQGLQLLSGPAGKEPEVRSYAIKCLLNERPEKVGTFRHELLVGVEARTSQQAAPNLFRPTRRILIYKPF
jgi:hypothetical protein